MIRFKLFALTLLLIVATSTGLAQENNQILTFEEFMGHVIEHHPLVKQANLTTRIGEANLMRSRGGFDPKIEVDYNRKKFKGTEYYDKLYTAFKVPTWYGVEFKANFEDNTGTYLDPSYTVPDGGLYGAGVSFSLAQGFLINERMADLKQAKLFEKQSKADRDYLVNNLVYKASQAYFDWLESSNEQRIFLDFLKNARTRLAAVTRSVEEGENAAIEITEARITLQNRELDLEAATLKNRKAALNVSNFLWIDEVPLQLEANVIPNLPTLELLENILVLEGITDVEQLAAQHPKIKSLQAKIEGLEVDRNFKKNKLLPKVDLQYNFITTEFDELNSYSSANYKAYVNVSFPIFLRKERGDLKLAKYKLQDTEFDKDAMTLTLKNKITEINAEISSLARQNELIKDIVTDYKTLVKAEERKFFLGESSLFLINAREQKLIDAQLKENSLAIKELSSFAKLYNAMGVSEPDFN